MPAVAANLVPDKADQVPGGKLGATILSAVIIGGIGWTLKTANDNGKAIAVLLANDNRDREGLIDLQANQKAIEILMARYDANHDALRERITEFDRKIEDLTKELHAK